MIAGKTVVIGLNCSHDAAAVILVDGQVVVAIAEERLVREKHVGGFPRMAIAYCLQEAGVDDIANVDLVVLNQEPVTDFSPRINDLGYQGRIVVNPSHHLLHAYYAWIASGFARPAILILDGAGYSYGEHTRRDSPLLGSRPAYDDMEEAESMFIVTADNTIEVARRRWGLWDSRYPHMQFPSLGHMFSMAAEYIFGHWQHAGKVMGLAPYGDPNALVGDIVTYDAAGNQVIDTSWVTRLRPRSNLQAIDDEICRNVAAKVQAEVERAVIHLCRDLHALTGATDLCLSGGVALNSVTNGLIRAQTPFDRLFVTPAAGDAGVALGAGLFGQHLIAGSVSSWANHDDYLGRRYSRQEVAAAVGDWAEYVNVEESEDPALDAAADLADGRIIGWFEGGSEFGPRALGHRSILCDPRTAVARDRLNSLVKYREAFRPYAASVLAEHAADFFDGDTSDAFMLTVVQVKSSMEDRIQAVRHVDGTCRIQSVSASHRGTYRSHIEHFQARTGIPMVLNTSFNIRGEPIIETPSDALRCFLACNLDVLYLEGLKITKYVLGAGTPGDVVPALVDGIELESVTQTASGAAVRTEHFARTRTGYRLSLSEGHFTLLRLVDAIRTLDQLASLTGRTLVETRNEAIDLQRRGVLCVKSHGIGSHSDETPTRDASI